MSASLSVDRYCFMEVLRLVAIIRIFVTVTNAEHRMHTRAELEICGQTLLIDKTRFCQAHTNPHKLIFIVRTGIGSSNEYYLRRQFIREAWGLDASHNFDIPPVLFAIGKADGNASREQQLLEEEDRQHGDILQFDFVDSYYNLTMKTVALLQWMSRRCANSSLVSVDDDTVVNVGNLLRYLKSNHEVALSGVYRQKMKPVRYVSKSSSDRWIVSESEYADSYYPNYISGGFTVYPAALIEPLAHEALNCAPALWIEDVFMTGIVAERLHIKRKNMPGLFGAGEFSGMLSLFRPSVGNVIGFYDCDIDLQLNLWKNYKDRFGLSNKTNAKRALLVFMIMCFLALRFKLFPVDRKLRAFAFVIVF